VSIIECFRQNYYGENMKQKIVCFLAVLVFGCFSTSLSNAATDCSGSYSPIPPGYRAGSGGVCAHLGLNTHAGVCQPGQEYETLCDDSPQGYRTCRGPRRCFDDRDRGRGGDDFYGGGRRSRPDNDCRGWDYNYDQPCPRGYINDDCRGGCEPY